MNGDVVKEKKYEAFGNILSSSSGTHEDKREFTGKEKDPTGFHYFGARYYFGDIGRFLIPDPHTLMPKKTNLTNPQELNPYVYCTNNPVDFVDENGLWQTKIERGNVYITRKLLLDAAVISAFEFVTPGGTLIVNWFRKQQGDQTLSAGDWISGWVGILPVESQLAKDVLTAMDIIGASNAIRESKIDRDKLTLFSKITGIEQHQDLTGGDIFCKIGKAGSVKAMDNFRTMEKINRYYEWLEEEFSDTEDNRQDEVKYRLWEMQYDEENDDWYDDIMYEIRMGRL